MGRGFISLLLVLHLTSICCSDGGDHPADSPGPKAEPASDGAAKSDDVVGKDDETLVKDGNTATSAEDSSATGGDIPGMDGPDAPTDEASAARMYREMAKKIKSETFGRKCTDDDDCMDKKAKYWGTCFHANEDDSDGRCDCGPDRLFVDGKCVDDWDLCDDSSECKEEGTKCYAYSDKKLYGYRSRCLTPEEHKEIKKLDPEIEEVFYEPRADKEEEKLKYTEAFNPKTEQEGS